MSNLSDEDSVHLDTPPKGRGRCCAQACCINPTRHYYPTYVCDSCGGHPHEQGCFEYEGNPFGRFDLSDIICLKCKDDKAKKEKREKEREKRKWRKEEKERKAEKLRKKTPFTVASEYAKKKSAK